MSVATAAAADAVAVLTAQSVGTAVAVLSAVGRLQSVAVGRTFVAGADFGTAVLVAVDSVVGLPASE